MPRSPVLRGQIDARDRAHQRHRRDRSTAAPLDDYTKLERWLEASRLGGRSREELLRLNLEKYLRETAHVEVNASERLRHLAIYLEGTSEAGAVGLDRIYQAALRLSPDEPSNWHSRGITAKHFAIIADNARERARHAQAALKHLKRAAALLPEDPDILYSLGKWEHAFGSKRAALGYFDRVLSQAPNHGFARLFRAYALHDSSSWDEAVRAYREVPLEQFTGSKAYIADEVLMNRADCRLMSGDREGALQDLQRLLERLEKEPHRAEPLELRRLEEACLGQLSAELKERWLRLGLVGNERVAQGQPPRPLQ